MEPLLQVEHLSVFFEQNGSQRLAVNDIGFTLPKGSFTALVGESGSGKTLTAYAIMQLLPASAKAKGSVLFHNNASSTNLLSCSEKEMNVFRGNKIAMMFQEPMSALNPLMTCGAQIAECLHTHKQLSKTAVRKQVLALLTTVELPEPESIYHKYPHQISGGQKQRVLLAMAISNQPELLIADEPTTALDIGLQHSMLQLLQKLQKQLNMTLLMISHDLALVSRYAKHILVMFRGEMVEKGLVAEVMRDPQHPYTQALLQCRVKKEWKGRLLPVLVDGVMQLPDADAASDEMIFPVQELLNPIITCHNLCVSYPEKKNFWGKVKSSIKALDHVSFEVKKGETLGIVGESGSGKSTLAKLLLHLISPDSGTYHISGDSFDKKNKRKNKNDYDIQLVFQDPYGSLNPRMQIGEAIAETIRVHQKVKKGAEKNKAMEWLEQVGLSPSMYHRYPHQFSGGQRKRIGIARALANHPNILVFDESLSALDVSVQAQMLNLIQQLKKKYGFTSIFIAHDLPNVYHICDRVLVMKEGKIVEQGTTTDVFHHPQNEYTRYLISLMQENPHHQK